MLISRVAGLLPPIDGVTMSLDDEQALRADVDRARLLGFGGKLHPSQADCCGERRLLTPADGTGVGSAVMEAAASAQGNAVRLDGKMIDRPVIERARALLVKIPPNDGASGTNSVAEADDNRRQSPVST